MKQFLLLAIFSIILYNVVSYNFQSKKNQLLFSKIFKNIAILSTTVAFTSNQLIHQVLAQNEIVVLGSNGRTGRLIINDLKSTGSKIRAVYREIPKDLIINPSDSIEYKEADVTKPNTLEPVMKDAATVIFASSASSKGGKVEEVDRDGVINVANEAIKLKIPKLIIISSGAITKPDSLGYKVTNFFAKGIMQAKLDGELGLQKAYEQANDPSIGYIIIRPGGLGDGDALGPSNIVLNQGDTVIGDINRADVAEVTVAAALSKTIPKDVVFEVYESGKGQPLESRFPKVSGYERDGRVLGGNYDVLFSGLKTGINGL